MRTATATTLASFFSLVAVQAFLLPPAPAPLSFPSPSSSSSSSSSAQARRHLGQATPPPHHTLLQAAGDTPEWPSDSSDDNYADTATGPAPGEEVVDTTARKTSLMELQQELLMLLVGQNRGFNIQESEREDIEDAIKMLEAENPTPRPTDMFATGNSPLSGAWRLIYTDAIDVLLLGLIPVAVLGRVYQNISPDGKEITNLAELQQGVSQLSFFPLVGRLGDSMARLRVEASSEVLSPIRQSLTFKSTKFEPLTLFGMDVTKQLQLPKVDFFNSPNVGWIETTYVDDKFRVGRSPGGLGGGGSVFVFVRETGSSEYGR